RLRGRRWRAALLALAVLLLGFALGFRLFFPVDALRQRLEGELARQSGARVELKRLSLGLPLSLALHDLLIDSRRPGVPPLRFDRLEVSPGWLSLFTGDPQIDVAGEVYAGELYLSMAHSGRFDLELGAVQFEHLPPVRLGETPVDLAGTLSGRIEAAGPPLEETSDTVIDLRLSGA
ncbi:MAG: type II secretion system protein GspN, partial [Desulfuromonadales bacterium]|nr:type II secretion system protein GspN [Desulfuromonadales bacterium]NIS43341.1 type II secretion system protein GspN [Desulfuromonadales bacterium]